MLSGFSKALDRLMDKLCAYPPLITDETRPEKKGNYWWTSMPASKWHPGKGPQKPDGLNE